jgi:hypothetical protein
LFENLQNKAQAAALRDEFVKALFSGALARTAAPRAALRNPEEAFVCAMFYNLGRLLCLFYFPEEWAEIRRLVAEEKKDETVAAQRVLGASFQQLGIGTAEAWGFPKRIRHSMQPLPPGPVRKAASPDDRLRLVSTFACEISAAAGMNDGARSAAFARIGDRNVSIESSPAVTHERVYWVNSGGRVMGIDRLAALEGRLEVVLDHNHTVAQITQFDECIEQLAVVTLVQADARLVENVHHPHQPRANLRRQTDALGFAT